MVPGSANESSAAAPSGGGAPQGGLAGALQDALKQRKQRVSGSGKFILATRSVFNTDWTLQMTRRMTTMIGKLLLCRSRDSSYRVIVWTSFADMH